MIVQDWGLIPYQEATLRQLEMLQSFTEDTLIVCSHPPVVTTGRGTQPGDIFAWQGEVVETSRGGRATYHGPNQIVIYPIIDLTKGDRQHIAAKDLHSYLRSLEAAIVASLREFQIIAEARTITVDGEGPSLTGVWVGEKKIASIGIAVKKWLTYHGLAVNFSRDTNAFMGIHPCGFQRSIMTSVEEVASVKPDRDDFTKVLIAELQSLLF